MDVHKVYSKRVWMLKLQLTELSYSRKQDSQILNQHLFVFWSKWHFFWECLDVHKVYFEGVWMLKLQLAELLDSKEQDFKFGLNTYLFFVKSVDAIESKKLVTVEEGLKFNWWMITGKFKYPIRIGPNAMREHTDHSSKKVHASDSVTHHSRVASPFSIHPNY